MSEAGSETARRAPVRFGPSAVATPANAVTAVRLALTVPLLVVIARGGASVVAVTWWVLLGLSDLLDGWLARKEGVTRSGAYLDPLADKVLAVGGFVALTVKGVYWWLPVALIAGRELAVSVHRSWRGRQGVSVPARFLGKVKTNAQLLAVGFALLPATSDVDWVLDATLWAAVVLTVVSGIDVVRSGVPRDEQ